MSSVLGDEECPRCGGVLCWERHTRGYWHWTRCLRCGFYESERLIWNDDTPALDDEGNWRFDHTKVVGRGAYVLKPKDAIASQVGSLGEDFGPELLRDFLDMDLIQIDCDPAKSYITYFDPETRAVTVLWGEMKPDLYVEYADE